MNKERYILVSEFGEPKIHYWSLEENKSICGSRLDDPCNRLNVNEPTCKRCLMWAEKKVKGGAA